MNRIRARRIRDWSLVLSSAGIPHRIASTRLGFRLRVAPSSRKRAIREIRLYEREVKDAPEEISFKLPAEFPWVRVLAFTFVILAINILIFNEGDSVVLSAGALSEAIRSGEIWRAVTALLIHADWGHFWSNALFFGLFLGILTSSGGFFFSLLLALTAGSLGNLINAFVHQPSHLSVGLSTAVFAAIGIASLWTASRNWKKLWIPLTGGLAFLSFFGMAEYSDIGAHLFGFLSGIFLGAVSIPMVKKNPPNLAIQGISFIVTLALLCWAWVSALGQF